MIDATRRPPLRATYRLQFHRDFTFAAAQALVPYLAELGVSHVYASPISTAVPGSTHGYDVADPMAINPELGGSKGFAELSAALRAHGMGLILDIVPNHMAASSSNPYWLEMLEFGPQAPGADVFDVLWETGRMLLPVLGDPLQATLEAGALALRLDSEVGRIVVAYADHVFPLSPPSATALLKQAAVAAPALDPCAAIWSALADGGDVEAARRALQTLGPGERAALEATLAQADLPALLETQHWRLAWWRTAAHDLNYRRFFNITDLAGVRVEDPEVFDLVHRLPLDLVRRGLVDGLRIDHIDGLVDPAGYCARLRDAVGAGVPIMVEKILERGEVLPPWPIEGTTGYERLNDINALFVDEAGYRALEADLRERQLLVGSTRARIAAAKRLIVEGSLSAEIDVLLRLARDGLDAEMKNGDLTEAALRNGLIALVVHCPVYRSYATAAGHTDEDMAVWAAIRAGVEANEDPLTVAAAQVLLGRIEHPQDDSDRTFLLRFQQITGPAMAKGFEDTELYRHPVLLSVNEVGGDLDHPSHSLDEMHALAAERAQAGAVDLIPLATHDTKRGPETRARLNALALAPDLWLDFLDEIQPACAPLAVQADGRAMPDALDARLIHQTLFSAWPITAERVETYLTKAFREAKRHSNWETPDEPYEAASLGFARALIEAPQAQGYRDALIALLARFAPAGRIFSLAQLVLQHTLPGTPDIYQGTEFPDFSLVDPDNRRPIDWNLRLASLSRSEGLGEGADLEKFALTRSLLALRRQCGGFAGWTYRPLSIASSPWRWFSFVREGAEGAVMVVVPTRVPLAGEDAPSLAISDLPGGEWRDLAGAAVAFQPASADGREMGGRSIGLPPERPLLVAVRAK